MQRCSQASPGQVSFWWQGALILLHGPSRYVNPYRDIKNEIKIKTKFTLRTNKTETTVPRFIIGWNEAQNTF